RFAANPTRSDEVTAAQWFGCHAEIVVIKHGKDGSIAYGKDGSSHRGSIFPAKVIKTFGAGDSYAAGFIYGLMQGWSPSRSMEFGSASASIVISSHSSSDAMPTVMQVEQFMLASKQA
ncbi:carbohydrate kinase family protein, partial [Paenibacillus sepulcri]|nr:carbohydrate kinase family protein [Paenibacillus sepulcri]